MPRDHVVQNRTSVTVQVEQELPARLSALPFPGGTSSADMSYRVMDHSDRLKAIRTEAVYPPGHHTVQYLTMQLWAHPQQPIHRRMAQRNGHLEKAT